MLEIARNSEMNITITIFSSTVNDIDLEFFFLLRNGFDSEDSERFMSHINC